MQRHQIRLSMLGVLASFLMASAVPIPIFAQSSYTALLRGAVMDSTGAVVPGARVTLTNVGTQVSEKRTTDEVGRYIFNGVQPAPYTVKVEAQGFKTLLRENVVLRVGEQTDLDFKLELGKVTETVEVKAAAPLLNTVSAALGAEVTNRYIIDMPLMDRDISGLAYLAPGVTEVIGARIGDMGGTVFASNGQRYGTAEFRADGALISYPEGGEGGTTAIVYKPLIEDIQEFKIQNNSFSAEYGNNGGTVVSMVTKSGTNQFHGSGWYFMRRPGFDANDFFSNAGGEPKGSYRHDQYGGSVGGPIKKEKTFFFFNVEKTRDLSPSTFTTTVPTDAQRRGDFSNTFTYDDNGNIVLQPIFNPYDTYTDAASGTVLRQPFAGNMITGNCNKSDPLNPSVTVSTPCLDPVALNVMKLYPEPTGSGDAIGLNNYTKKLLEVSPGYHYDFKIDQIFNAKNRISVRYGHEHSTDSTPNYQGDSDVLDSTHTTNNSHNAVLAYDLTPSPTVLWTTRLGVDRWHTQNVLNSFDLTSVGLPSYLTQYSGLQRLPSFNPDNYEPILESSCADTLEAHTQWQVSSLLTKVYHAHNLKFGGELRNFFNNFWQPCDVNGSFFFFRGDSLRTKQPVFSAQGPGVDFQGNTLADMLLGFGSDGWMGTTPHTSNKSKDQGFFANDDWKVSQRLTLNLGLRYEWSTPYTERFNRLQWSDFGGDSGIKVPAMCDPQITAQFGTCSWPGRELFGVSRLAGPGHRTIRSDRNNFGPRLGFAYRLNDRTVLRGGAGIYYGFNPATNFQYVGTTWNKSVNFQFSKDSGLTQFATLENPLPNGYGPPAGPDPNHPTLSRWGFDNGNNLSDTFRNAEIYQWSFGIERELGGDTLIDVNYSANRSTHLPWHGGTRNRNFISAADRLKYGTDGLSTSVANPLQSLFVGSNAIFNEPASIYNDATVPLGNILRPFPQFDGSFEGLPIMAANSSYNSLQIRLEKRYSHGLNFGGHYTYSRFLDSGSEGANNWIGALQTGDLQDPTNLRPEWGTSANDTPHRLAFAVTYELPVGRGRTWGNQMNRALDGIFGGWRVNSIITLQSGNPIAVSDGSVNLSDGRARPNVTGNARSNFSIGDVVDGKGNFFNLSAFSHPPDETPGNAPRYFSNVRGPAIHNTNFGVFKEFRFKENMFLQLRAEFFNFFNTPRFRLPHLDFGNSSTFGTITHQFNSPRQGQVGVRFVF